MAERRREIPPGPPPLPRCKHCGGTVAYGRCDCAPGTGRYAPKPRGGDGCEYERDSEYFRTCCAPHRFVVSRADGDLSYSGGREGGVYYVCEEHLADAVMGMADGDDVGLTVTIRYDDKSVWRVVVVELCPRDEAPPERTETDAREWFENLAAQIPNPSWVAVRLEVKTPEGWHLVEARS